MTTLTIQGDDPIDRCLVCQKEHLTKELQQHRLVFQDASVFRCSICDGDYLSKEELWNHQDFHTNAEGTKDLNYEELRIHCKMYKCLLCTDQRVYQGRSLYWKHIHGFHGGCNECFRFKTNAVHSLNSTVPNNSNVVIYPPVELYSTIKCECPICDEIYSNKSLLSKHIEMNHRMIVCNICTMTFCNSHELQVHKNANHADSAHNIQPEPDSGVHSRYDGKNYQKSHNNDKADLHQHRNIAIKLEISAEETSLQSQDDHNVIPHRLVKYDEYGIMESKNISNLTNQNTNIKEESQEDDVLITPTDSEDSMQSDEDSSEHNADYQIDRSKMKGCSICRLKFPNDTRMRYHRMIAHTDPRYKCSNCPKSFHAKHMLTRHETTHLQEQNATCKLCSETYQNELRLQRHLKSAHSVPCDLCDLKFTSTTKVDRHKRKLHKDNFPVDRWKRVKIPGSEPKPPIWNLNQLQEAITAVVTQRCGISQASTQHNIPKGTLYDKILGKGNRMAILQEFVLSPEEESAVLNFACTISLSTHNKRTKRSLSSILDFMNQFKSFQEKADRFKFGEIAGFRWWWAFCRKHSIDPPRSKFDGRKRAKFADMKKDGDDLI